MRKHLPTFAALAAAACLAFLALGANATPISVNLSSCAGLTSCPNNGVTLSGWELDSGTWSSAYLVFKNEPNNETGLGVMCNVGFSGPKCGQDEINTTPAQYISVGIGGIKFSSLSIGIGSDDLGGNSNSTVPETAYIYGMTCANGVCGQGTLLGSHAGGKFPSNAWTFNFTSKQLSGFSFLYVTPLCDSGSAGGPSSCPSAPDANILLASLTYNSVPEPAVLGMFGLGILLIGGFVGLRRRQH